MFAHLFLALAFLGSWLPVSAADTPRMTIVMTRGDEVISHTKYNRIGVNVPIRITWTLEHAPDDARWVSCYVPTNVPIVIDSITPAGSRESVVRYTFPSETRQVTIAFHATSHRMDGPTYKSMSCRAETAEGRDIYAYALFRIGLLSMNDVFLPVSTTKDLLEEIQ